MARSPCWKGHSRTSTAESEESHSPRDRHARRVDDGRLPRARVLRRAAEDALSASAVTSALRMLHTFVITAATGDADLDGPPPACPKKESNLAAKGALVLSTLFALGLFIALPQLLATGLIRLLGLDLGLTDWQFHALTRLLQARRAHDLPRGVISRNRGRSAARVPVSRRRAQDDLRLRGGAAADRRERTRAVAAPPALRDEFLITVVLISVILGSMAPPLVLPNAEAFSVRSRRSRCASGSCRSSPRSCLSHADEGAGVLAADEDGGPSGPEGSPEPLQ